MWSNDTRRRRKLTAKEVQNHSEFYWRFLSILWLFQSHFRRFQRNLTGFLIVSGVLLVNWAIRSTNPAPLATEATRREPEQVNPNGLLEGIDHHQDKQWTRLHDWSPNTSIEVGNRVAIRSSSWWTMNVHWTGDLNTWKPFPARIIFWHPCSSLEKSIKEI